MVNFISHCNTRMWLACNTFQMVKFLIRLLILTSPCHVNFNIKHVILKASTQHTWLVLIIILKLTVIFLKRYIGLSGFFELFQSHKLFNADWKIIIWRHVGLLVKVCIIFEFFSIFIFIYGNIGRFKLHCFM